MSMVLEHVGLAFTHIMLHLQRRLAPFLRSWRLEAQAAAEERAAAARGEQRERHKEQVGTPVSLLLCLRKYDQRPPQHCINKGANRVPIFASFPWLHLNVLFWLQCRNLHSIEWKPSGVTIVI
jgi:hypothetical protein